MDLQPFDKIVIFVVADKTSPEYKAWMSDMANNNNKKELQILDAQVHQQPQESEMCGNRKFNLNILYGSNIVGTYTTYNPNDIAKIIELIKQLKSQSQSGGDDDVSYKSLYLKYKSKYLVLKKVIMSHA
jgi:hypothetical protein